jgi:hypothetical protein
VLFLSSLQTKKMKHYYYNRMIQNLKKTINSSFKKKYKLE